MWNHCHRRRGFINGKSLPPKGNYSKDFSPLDDYRGLNTWGRGWGLFSETTPTSKVIEAHYNIGIDCVRKHQYAHSDQYSCHTDGYEVFTGHYCQNFPELFSPSHVTRTSSSSLQVMGLSSCQVVSQQSVQTVSCLPIQFRVFVLVCSHIILIPYYR